VTDIVVVNAEQDASRGLDVAARQSGVSKEAKPVFISAYSSLFI
jgi:hypothetical protein